jgi:hypothetical protein
MGDGDETKKGNWAHHSGLRMTEAIAVAAIELAGASFANWGSDWQESASAFERRVEAAPLAKSKASHHV